MGYLVGIGIPIGIILVIMGVSSFLYDFFSPEEDFSVNSIIFSASLFFAGIVMISFAVNNIEFVEPTKTIKLYSYDETSEDFVIGFNQSGETDYYLAYKKKKDEGGNTYKSLLKMDAGKTKIYETLPEDEQPYVVISELTKNLKLYLPKKGTTQEHINIVH